MEFIELTEKEFLKYSESSPMTSFFQMPRWAEVKETNGWKHYYVGVKEKNKIIAATLLLAKEIKMFKTMFYAPRGFLMDYKNLELLDFFTKEIKKYLKTKKALFLKINPYIDYQERDVDGKIIEGTANDTLINKLKELGYKHNGFYIDQDSKKDLEPRWISVLDTKDKDIDTIFKNLRSGARYGVNNSKKNSLKVIEADYDQLIEFKDLMKHTAERREFVDRPLSYYQNMYKILKKDNLVKVLLVEINFKEQLKEIERQIKETKDKIEEYKGNERKEKQIKEFQFQINSFEEKAKDLKETISEEGDKKIIAGGWYMLFGREIIYLFGASYKKYMKYNSQYLLQYEMIKYAIDNKYEGFNFYGIDGNFSKESKGYGLFDFKRGFNACVHELIGEFDLVIDNNRYKLYNFSFALYKKIKKLIK